MVKPINELSHVVGDKNLKLIDRTVYQILLDSKETFPNKVAIIFRQQKIRLTYKELVEQVDVLASALLEIGVVKGDRVGIWSPNRIEWVLTQFATAAIGAILTNINPAYRVMELEYALNKVGCKVLVTAKNFRSSNYVEMLTELAPEIKTSTHKLDLFCKKLPHLKRIIAFDDNEGTGKSANSLNNLSGIYKFSEVMKIGKQSLKVHGSDFVRRFKLHCDEPINIQFTSGTTGSPKSATLTHRNIVNNAYSISMYLKMDHRDCMCIPVPLYHCFGMVMSVLVSVSVAAQMVFPGEAFDPQQTLAAIEEESCTVLQGVPTMFITELEYADKYNLKSLRTGIMAGSICPIETMRLVMHKMHMRDITIAYGMTETSPVSFQTDQSDSLEKRTTTVGRILPNLEAKLVKKDGNSIAKIGEVGEIWVRGYSTMLGYWGEKESGLTPDGWMATGDLATMCSNGYVTIVGRCKDIIIRGAENIYPREIEEFLYKHTKVQTVTVFGVPDEKFGEEVCAWIILKHVDDNGSPITCTADDIKSFCKGKISHYKIPRYIKFIDQSALPMTVSGKIQKYICREIMNNELLKIHQEIQLPPSSLPQSKL